MARDLDRWEKIERLGEGGQGEVYLVRTPERVVARNSAMEQIRPSIGNINGYDGHPSESFVKNLLQSIADYNRPDSDTEIGALKEFKIRTDDPAEAEKAVGRLQAEVEALQKLSHPAVLKLLAANVPERFIVTEFHAGGPLAKRLHLYKGLAMAALEAFRELVDGVRAIHEAGGIHRDIKTENIFVARSGNLVLGDFGIVFFREGGRVTSTFERVGSHYWMAPWAYKNQRLTLDEMNFKLDIYPLGKVLWSMVSGHDGFLREEFRVDDNDLTKLFPNDPAMPLINDLLDQCVVRNEKECLFQNALDLRLAIDGLMNKIKARRGERPDGADTWLCRLCGKGSYRATNLNVLGQIAGRGVGDSDPFAAYVCDNVNCRHVELFRANR
jgi:serine/threonine protein kinase